jgi:hypothetical protein
MIAVAESDEKEETEGEDKRGNEPGHDLFGVLVDESFEDGIGGGQKGGEDGQDDEGDEEGFEEGEEFAGHGGIGLGAATKEGQVVDGEFDGGAKFVFEEPEGFPFDGVGGVDKEETCEGDGVKDVIGALDEGVGSIEGESGSDNVCNSEEISEGGAFFRVKGEKETESEAEVEDGVPQCGEDGAGVMDKYVVGNNQNGDGCETHLGEFYVRVIGGEELFQGDLAGDQFVGDEDQESQKEPEEEGH